VNEGWGIILPGRLHLMTATALQGKRQLGYCIENWKDCEGFDMVTALQGAKLSKTSRRVLAGVMVRGFDSATSVLAT